MTSRRGFLIAASSATAGFAGCAVLPPVIPTSPAGGARAARARAEALMASTTVIDMHSHAPLNRRRLPLDFSASLRAGRMSAICMAMTSDRPVIGVVGKHLAALREPAPGELWAHMLDQLGHADQVVASFATPRVLTRADLLARTASGQPGVISSTEGSDCLEGRIDRLDTLHARGVRHVQLVHYRADNGVGDIQTEAPQVNGATPFGLDVVRGCNRLGMVVDVAHATLPTVRRVADVCSTPLVLSHTALATTPGLRSRSVSREHAQCIADTGGVVGVWSSAGSFRDLAAYTEGLARLADAIGVDHVGIGTDMYGLLTPLPFGYPDFPDLVAHLFDHFGDDDVRKIIGGNYLRVFAAATRS